MAFRLLKLSSTSDQLVDGAAEAIHVNFVQRIDENVEGDTRKEGDVSLHGCEPHNSKRVIEVSRTSGNATEVLEAGDIILRMECAVFHSETSILHRPYRSDPHHRFGDDIGIGGGDDPVMWRTTRGTVNLTPSSTVDLVGFDFCEVHTKNASISASGLGCVDVQWSMNGNEYP